MSAFVNIYFLLSGIGTEIQLMIRINFKMERIMKESGFEPILEKIFKLSNQETLLSCSSVNKYWNKVLQNPTFWLAQLKLAKMPEEILQKYKELANKIQDNDELSKMVSQCMVRVLKSNEKYGFPSPVMAASKHGLVPILKFMATYTKINFRKVEYDKNSKTNLTGIHQGVYSGKVEIMEYFHELGYNLNIHIDVRWTPFLLAVYWSRLEVIKFLATILENPLARLWYRRTAFHLAAEYGRHESLKCLLKIFGSNLVNVPIQMNNFSFTNKNNYTALQLAVENGHAEVVEVLAEFVNNPNRAISWPNPPRSTPLKMALSNNDSKMVKVLLKVLCEKMDSNPKEIMRTLQGLPLPLSYQPNPNQDLPFPNFPMSTLLKIALSKNDSKMVKEVLKELCEKMDSNPQEVMSALRLLN